MSLGRFVELIMDIVGCTIAIAGAACIVALAIKIIGMLFL